MSSENVQALIEALSGLGDGAKEAFIWYVVMHYGVGLLKAFVVAGVILLVAFKIARLITSAISSDKLRIAAKVKSHFTDNELEKACNVLADNSKDINNERR